MKLALVKNRVAIEGDYLSDIITQTQSFKFDLNKGELYFQGKKDTVSYTVGSWTSKEMLNQMNHRALELLIRQGWTLYKA